MLSFLCYCFPPVPKDFAYAFALCGREMAWPVKFTAHLEQQRMGSCQPNLGRPK